MSKKNKGGRPPKLSDVTIAKLEEVFAMDGSIEEACSFAGIHPATYHRWIEKKPGLRDRFMALRERPVLAARTTVVTAIKTDPAIAIKYLERKRRKEFGNQIGIDVGADRESIGELTDLLRAMSGAPVKQDDPNTKA